MSKSVPDQIIVDFRPAADGVGLLRMPHSKGEPIVFRSGVHGPYDAMVNLDGLVMFGLLQGAVEDVEIWGFTAAAGPIGASNDTGQAQKMSIDLTNLAEVERNVVLTRESAGSGLILRVPGTSPPSEEICLGGGLFALVDGRAFLGLRVADMLG